MTTEAHTAREGFESRLRDMRAILALANGDSLDHVERLQGLGYVNPELDEDDRWDDARDLADGYVYGAHVLYRKDDTGPGESVSRVELLLAGGGPTHILTWDERGAGWGDYFDSWATPDCYQLTEDEWMTVGAFLCAFVTPDLDYS